MPQDALAGTEADEDRGGEEGRWLVIPLDAGDVTVQRAGQAFQPPWTSKITLYDAPASFFALG